MLETSKKLIEHENNELKKRKEIIDSVIKEVEELLIKNNFTLKEWTLVINNFNNLSEVATLGMPIKELSKRIKIKHERRK